MGDRFYMQQLQTLGDCPGNPKAKPKKRASKAETVEVLGCPALEKLTAVDLAKLSPDMQAEMNMQEGRLKAPFILECEKLDNSVAWNKLTIADLKQVIERYNKC